MIRPADAMALAARGCVGGGGGLLALAGAILQRLTSNRWQAPKSSA